VSKLNIVAIAAVGLVVGAATAIFVSLRSGNEEPPSEARPAATSSGAESRRRAEQFFGGDSNRDVRGGQEIKPRW
jgi:Ti type entry exclusion protein TrbK